MSCYEHVEEIYTDIGYLAEISMGDIVVENQETIRLEQIKHIINWVQLIKQDLDGEHNLRLDLEDQLNRIKMVPIREEMLTNIDLSIQEQMKQLNVDTTIGAQLILKIMNVVDFQTLPIVQENDGLKIHIDQISFQLSEANARIIAFESGTTNNNLVDSVEITNSVDVAASHASQIDLNFANQKILQLEKIITNLEEQKEVLIRELNGTKSKNNSLVEEHISPLNKVEDLQKRLLKNEQGFKDQIDSNLKMMNHLRQENSNLQTQVEKLTYEVSAKKPSSLPIVDSTPVGDFQNDYSKQLELELQLQSKDKQIFALTTRQQTDDRRIKELIDELAGAHDDLLIVKNRIQGGSEEQQQSQMVASANRKISQLTIQYQSASNQIAELQQELSRKNNLQPASSSPQVSVQLLHAEQRIEDYIRQLTLSNNRITDLEKNLEVASRQSLDKNQGGYDKKVEVVSNQLLASNNKVDEMMKMVANYQNNVIDLELDKEALVFQLNDSRAKQNDYLNELNVQKTAVSALKDQLIKTKQTFYGTARSNIKEVETQIQKRIGTTNEGYALNIIETGVEKSDKSNRQHSHRKIFEGKVRGSQTSSVRGAVY